MKTLGMIIFLLSLPIAIFAWYLFVKEAKKRGTGGVRYLGGAVAAFVAGLATMVVAVFVDPDTRKSMANQPVEQTQQVAQNSVAPTTPTPAEQKPVETATPEPQSQKIQSLDMDFDTFRRRVNEDFATAGLPYKIPSNIEPTGENVRKTATIQLDDSLGVIVATDPATNKITGISTIMSGSSDELKNMQRAGASGLALASADGDDGNKTVGSELIKMMTKTIKQWGKKPDGVAEDKMVRNGIQYGISVSKMTGIMMYAEPVKQ